jgi:putative transposase
MALRLITIKRQTGQTFDLITNHMTANAPTIAPRYKARWQIELLFKWIKQNLNIRKFIAYNENPVRLHIACQNSTAHIRPKRFTELISAFIPTTPKIETIEKPPPPSRPIKKPDLICSCNYAEL